jgi:hypothetical protein
LNITLNNSSLSLKDGGIDDVVTFKEDDTLHIVGKNNVIEVRGFLIINCAINFDEYSELNIKLSTPNAAVIIANESNAINLGKGVNLTISGPGLAALIGEINFNESFFLLKDGIRFFPLFAWFKGIGDFEVMSGTMQIIRPAILNVGASNTDIINIKISNEGMIRLGGSSDIIIDAKKYFQNKIQRFPVFDFGRLDLGYGSSSLLVSPNSSIVVEGDGKLSINMVVSEYFEEVLAPGNFRGLFLSPNGQLSLKPGGKIVFAENKDAFDPIDKKLIIWQSDGTVTFDGADASGKTGVIEYVSSNAAYGFQGQMVFGNGNFATTTGISAEQLVRTLINRSSVLVTAAQLLDANNVGWIRLKNGKIIQMQTGDVIVQEEPNGSVRGRDVAGKNILFTLSGIRQS